MNDDSDDEIVVDVSREEAVAAHVEGSLHCALPGHWEKIEQYFNRDDHPWLDGHVGAMHLDGLPFTMMCIDTTGLTEEQQNYVLNRWYSVEDMGVMGLKESPAAQAMLDAAERGRKRRRS